MKLLSCCLLCLFVTSVRLRPQVTKLFPVGELVAQQASNATKAVDKFWEKLRVTYNLVFRQPDNGSVERILARNASDLDLQALKLLWANQVKLDNYTSLKYPNDSFLDRIKSLSVPQDYESGRNSSGLARESSVEVKSAIKATDGSNASLANPGERSTSNKTRTLNDDDWLNDIQPLGQLELQDEESDKKTETGIATPGIIIELPTTVGRHLIEWLGSLFGFTYNIYAKLSGAACGDKKATQ